MKRLLTSIFAGVIVFGLVAAFAASLQVNTDGLGAGQVTVGNCDTNGAVDLSYTTAFGASEYEVTEVIVSDIDAECTSISVRVGTESFDNVATGGAATMTFDITDTSANGFEPAVHVAVSS